MSHDGKRPVTLEDLLRLKRAERPALEFWDQFDRELRAKQLAALVRKRPWWRQLPRAFAGFNRYHVPVGAAAVIALTFLTVRQYNSAPDESPRPDKVLPVASGGVPAADAASAGGAVQVAESVVVAAAEPVTEADTVVAVSAAGPELQVASAVTPVIPLLVGAIDEGSRDEYDSPSARYIAANLAAVKAAELATRGILGGARSFESRAAGMRTAAVEPLQQMTPPSEVRLARYRSPLVATVAEDTSDRTGERIARRISGDRLYDQIGRIGARGDSVSWKF